MKNHFLNLSPHKMRHLDLQIFLTDDFFLCHYFYMLQSQLDGEVFSLLEECNMAGVKKKDRKFVLFAAREKEGSDQGRWVSAGRWGWDAVHTEVRSGAFKAAHSRALGATVLYTINRPGSQEYFQCDSYFCDFQQIRIQIYVITSSLCYPLVNK